MAGYFDRTDELLELASVLLVNDQLGFISWYVLRCSAIYSTWAATLVAKASSSVEILWSQLSSCAENLCVELSAEFFDHTPLAKKTR